MAMIAVPYAIASGSHSAELFRDALQALVSGTGVVGSSDLQVTAHSPANMSVNVGVGQAVVPGTLGATGVFPNNLNYQGYTGNVQALTQQGVYYCFNNSLVNVTIAAADPTNPRIDLVVVSDPDAQYSGSSNTPVLQVITGTPAPSPAAPTCPASSIVLAQVAVAANATSIGSGNITDKRPYLALTAPERGNPAGFAYATSGNVVTGTQFVVLSATAFLKGGMTFQTAGTTGLVAPVTGIYQVSGQVKITNAAATPLEAVAGKNGTVVLHGGQTPGATANFQGSVVSGLVSCNTGDVINLGYNASATVPFEIDSAGTDVYLSAALVSQ